MTVRPHWDSSDTGRLMAMRRKGRPFAEIGVALSRTAKACEQRYYLELRGHRRERFGSNERLAALALRHAVPEPEPAPAATSQAAVRARSLAIPRAGDVDPRDIAARGITAVIFGDPLPGRWALDQRRRQQSTCQRPEGER